MKQFNFSIKIGAIFRPYGGRKAKITEITSNHIKFEFLKSKKFPLIIGCMPKDIYFKCLKLK